MSIKANAIESLNKSLSIFRKLGSRERVKKTKTKLRELSKSQDSNDFHPTDKSSKEESLLMEVREVSIKDINILRNGLRRWWARWGLNPRPLGYQPSALTRLSYGPASLGYFH